MSDQLRRAFDRLRRASEDRDVIYGRMGKPDGYGNFTVAVADRPGWVYVRTGTFGEQSVTVALNMGVPFQADRPVKLRRLSSLGGYVVESSHESMIEGFAGGAYLGDVAPHSHQIGSGLEYEIEALRMQPGRVSFYDGLQVYIGEFRYYHNGVWKTYMGSTFNLSTPTDYRPTTAGYWAWVLVGVNPNTNAATAVTGTEYLQSTDLTIDLIDDIDFGVNIPCTAIKLKEADVSVWDINDYQDARGWFNTSPTFNDTINAIMTDADTSVMVDADGNVMVES